MALTTYNKLLEKLEDFADAHLQIKRFGSDFSEQRPNLATESEMYPYLYVSPVSGTPNYDLNNITVEITCYDIIQKDRDNINTIVSDCHLILTDLYGYYNQGKDADIIALNATQTPLNNEDLDYVAGWRMQITFELEGWCTNAIPMTPITPGADACEDASYTLKDTAGATISSGTIASGASSDITAPDGTVNVNKSDATLISAQTVVSNGTTNYNVADSNVTNSDLSYDVDVKATESLSIPDSTLNFNSVSQGSIVSVKTVDIDLEDGAGNPVTPDAVSLVGNTLTIDVTTGGGLTTESAKLMKTGQTTSYRTGDDGDLEKGRSTDFLTLPGNNPFGNTLRFTTTAGIAGTPGTVQWILDWSTYDGSTVLGYVNYFWTINSGTNLNWNDAIDYCLAYSLGGFSSCRLANVNEMVNLFNWESSSGVLAYVPFSTTTHSIWTSNTLALATVNGVRVVTNTGQVTYSNKTTVTARYLPVRDFTNAELGI